MVVKKTYNHNNKSIDSGLLTLFTLEEHTKQYLGEILEIIRNKNFSTIFLDYLGNMPKSLVSAKVNEITILKTNEILSGNCIEKYAYMKKHIVAKELNNANSLKPIFKFTHKATVKYIFKYTFLNGNIFTEIPLHNTAYYEDDLYNMIKENNDTNLRIIREVNLGGSCSLPSSDAPNGYHVCKGGSFAHRAWCCPKPDLDPEQEINISPSYREGSNNKIKVSSVSSVGSGDGCRPSAWTKKEDKQCRPPCTNGAPYRCTGLHKCAPADYLCPSLATSLEALKISWRENIGAYFKDTPKPWPKYPSNEPVTDDDKFYYPCKDPFLSPCGQLGHFCYNIYNTHMFHGKRFKYGVCAHNGNDCYKAHKIIKPHADAWATAIVTIIGLMITLGLSSLYLQGLVAGAQESMEQAGAAMFINNLPEDIVATTVAEAQASEASAVAWAARIWNLCKPLPLLYHAPPPWSPA